MRRQDRPEPKTAERLHANYYMVNSGYFHVMQTRILAGRDFDLRDREGSALVAIINQTFARRIFPSEAALGKKLVGWNGKPVEIVGIVEDGKYTSLNDESKLAIFWPILQHYHSTTTVIARSSLPPEQAVHSIQQVVHELDPALPFYQAGSLDDHLRLPLFPARLAATLLGAFGGLAIVLAATGVYGVMAYAVSRRRREIGIRMAIGASQAQVMGLVLRRTVIMMSAGAILGALAALATGGLMSPILYGVAPRDPRAFLLAALLIGFFALAAAWLPARRAAAIAPASALRED